MEKSFNLKVLETRDNISKIINTSKLPISMITAIIRDLLNEIMMVEKQIIEQEQKEYEKEAEKVSDNNIIADQD